LCTSPPSLRFSIHLHTPSRSNSSAHLARNALDSVDGVKHEIHPLVCGCGEPCTCIVRSSLRFKYLYSWLLTAERPSSSFLTFSPLAATSSYLRSKTSAFHPDGIYCLRCFVDGCVECSDWCYKQYWCQFPTSTW
jgi:hypothetical protein